jgi:hypothetical protein
MQRSAGLVTLGVSLILMGLAALSLPTLSDRFPWAPDPAHGYEVIAVESENGSGRYAVTWRYLDPDSSSDVFATWVLRAPPPVGSTDPPPGSAEPVLVWTDDGDIVARRWLQGRLVATAAKGTERRPGPLDDCYTEDGSAHLVCFDPSTVHLVGEGT